MSKLIIPLLCVVSIAHAECFTRSSTVSESKAPIERIADVERSVFTLKNGMKCRVSFRAYISSNWETAEGEALGSHDSSIDQLCAKAMDSGRARILDSVAGKKLSSTQEMICTDEEMKEEKDTVSIGDIVYESQVQPHPAYKDVFMYHGSQCRWFIESTPNIGRVDVMQGVICKAPQRKVWKVVDKW